MRFWLLPITIANNFQSRNAVIEKQAKAPLKRYRIGLSQDREWFFTKPQQKLAKIRHGPSESAWPVQAADDFIRCN